MMLTLEGVTMTVHSASGDKPIISDVSFAVDEGEAFGIIGESGSGKSMTLRAILAAEPAGTSVTGKVMIDGRPVRSLSHAGLRELRANTVAAIAQNPQAVVNPVLQIGRYLAEGMCDAQGIPKEAARDRARRLLREVGIDDPERVLASFPHQLSGGMLQRVVIAGALAGEPRLLLADEPTTALDVTTQAEVVAILDDLRRARGLTMVFVTHDLDLAAAVCDRIAVMSAGEIVEIGTPERLRAEPLHPYTRLLMDSRPQLEASVDLLPVIPGNPVSASEVPEGCRFAPRCPWAEDRCRVGRIPLRAPDGARAAAAGRLVRCLRSEELRSELAGGVHR